MTDQLVPVIVLAGGASRRMGTDKRLVDIDGTPMLQRVIDGLPEESRILVVIEASRPLPLDMLARDRLELIPDRRLSKGPLGGLEAGLMATDEEVVLVLAGDMPWVPRAVLDLVVTRLRSVDAAEIACLVVDGRPQPFPMACRRAVTRVRTARLLDRGERRMSTLLEDSVTLFVGEPEWRREDPDGGSIRDIDTPTDLERTR